MNFLTESNNYLIDFTYFFLLLSCGFVLASIPVSILLNKQQITEEVIETYEEKYCLDDLNKNDKPNINNIVMEQTPDGLVLMRYNSEEKGFEYWIDKKNINFKILKTICRKYCLLFNTKELYIDTYKEYLRDKEKWEKKREEDIQAFLYKKEEFIEEEKDDCVFIKPKSILNQKTQKKEIVIDWRDNKFIRRGTIAESPMHKKKEVKKIKFSFEDFKNMKNKAV